MLTLSACATMETQNKPEPEKRVAPTPRVEGAPPLERTLPQAPRPPVPETAATNDTEKAPAAEEVDDTPAAHSAGVKSGSENVVYFSSGDTTVDDTGKTILRRNAARLKKNPRLVVTLVGHTDPLGSRSYNLAIAEERIDSVFEFLLSLGVSKAQMRRLSAKAGYGTINSTCKSSVCRQKMRRVDLVYPKPRRN